ncbi:MULTISPECIES: hypothetical protein [Rhizobium]|uniref:hypothetical protein n=1 Tax=Rhizobium TaxID=379 RepID=UPI001C91A6CC|nr:MULTISPECIES: hypothetical protein [Rhizobium]MBY3271401.1 hypothetical protein [Rhizobium laguerreae]MBY5741016.1 hypothetical protein [Rhizobium leguminosarum]
MSKNRTEVFIEFLGADTSVPKVRHTMCVVICLIAPVVMGLGVWWWLPDHGWPLLCQIAAPLFGFGASVLWLLWPWFRTDIETAHRVMVVTSREIDHDGEPISEEPSEIKVTPIGSILDKAEKGSYRYVGGALALSWLLTLIPIVQAARDPAPPSEDVAILSRSLQELASAVHQHSQKLGDLSRDQAPSRVSEATIREVSAKIDALERRIPPPR